MIISKPSRGYSVFKIVTHNQNFLNRKGGWCLLWTESKVRRRGQWSKAKCAKCVIQDLEKRSIQSADAKARSNLSQTLANPAWLLHHVYLGPWNLRSISPVFWMKNLNSMINRSSLNLYPPLLSSTERIILKSPTKSKSNRVCEACQTRSQSLHRCMPQVLT